MTLGNSEPPADDLGARLRAARQRLDVEEARQRGPSTVPRSLTGMALRVGVEMVAGLVVGGGIGWLLDAWLDTSPLMMIVFFILGAAAGMMNVIRTARAINRAGAGETESAKAPQEGKDRGGSP